MKPGAVISMKKQTETQAVNDKLPLLRKNVVMKRNGLVEAVMTVMLYAYLCVCITEM